MIYSVNGAGKIGHLHAKELNWIIISHHVYRLLSKFIGLDFIVLCMNYIIWSSQHVDKFDIIIPILLIGKLGAGTSLVAQWLRL